MRTIASLGVVLMVSIGQAAEPCKPDLTLKLTSVYEQHLAAAKDGDLSALKQTSTPSEAKDIALSEEHNRDKLGPMIYAFSPRLGGAKEVKCEHAGDRARLIVTHDVTEESDAKTIGKREGFSAIMFQRVGGDWKVGKRASTQPFATQPLADLLKHEALQLP